MDNPNIGKTRTAEPYASKTASFYRNKSGHVNGVKPASPAAANNTRARPQPGHAAAGKTATGRATAAKPFPASASATNTANLGNPAHQSSINPASMNQLGSPVGSNTANLTGAFPATRRRSSTSFKIALFSLLTSLLGLSVIFALQVEMKGAGAYLYLLVTVSAFVYIVATMVYVLHSTRRHR